MNQLSYPARRARCSVSSGRGEGCVAKYCSARRNPSLTQIGWRITHHSAISSRFTLLSRVPLTDCFLSMTAVSQAICTLPIGAIYYFLTGFAGNWALDRLASFEESDYIFKGGFFFAIYWYLWFRDGSDRERRRWDIIAIVIAAPLAT